MKPVMTEEPRQDMAQDIPDPEAVGLETNEGELPKEAMDLVNGIKVVLFDDGFVPAFQAAVEGATDFAAAAALLCFSLIERGQREMGKQFNDKTLFAPGGVADYVMTAIYAYGQGIQIPEAADQASYDKAIQIVADMNMKASGEMGGAPMGQPAPQAPMAQAPMGGMA